MQLFNTYDNNIEKHVEYLYLLHFISFILSFSRIKLAIIATSVTSKRLISLAQHKKAVHNKIHDLQCRICDMS